MADKRAASSRRMRTSVDFRFHPLTSDLGSKVAGSTILFFGTAPIASRLNDRLQPSSDENPLPFDSAGLTLLRGLVSFFLVEGLFKRPLVGALVYPHPQSTVPQYHLTNNSEIVLRPNITTHLYNWISSNQMRSIIPLTFALVALMGGIDASAPVAILSRRSSIQELKAAPLGRRWFWKKLKGNKKNSGGEEGCEASQERSHEKDPSDQGDGYYRETNGGAHGSKNNGMNEGSHNSNNGGNNDGAQGATGDGLDEGLHDSNGGKNDGAHGSTGDGIHEGSHDSHTDGMNDGTHSSNTDGIHEGDHGYNNGNGGSSTDPAGRYGTSDKGTANGGGAKDPNEGKAHY
ncbi:hypothetical protein O181_036655 [Austropuccinia psidii MF-1]|uniref:Uncharacterized protein n=1 Tax=Austropuccinia psidii MF-1 TaxID=1389203 RepID=A0A9Q3D9D1_9BASI|nr:hypothetical protein [Austropuccinia psidii MF-1]